MTAGPFVRVALVGVSLAMSGRAEANRRVTPQAAQVDDGKREFTISGCLLRSGYAGYQVDDVKIDAIDRKPSADSAVRSAADALPKKWSLQGGGNLGPRVGEQVQVVGRSDWREKAPAEKGIDEPPDKAPTLDVQSVKTLASGCP
jgi:hypothetical protein